MVQHGLAEKHTVGHVLEDCVSRGEVFETDGVAYFFSELYVHFLCNSFGDGHGCDSAGLGAGDGFAVGVACFNEELWYLCGFA